MEGLAERIFSGYISGMAKKAKRGRPVLEKGRAKTAAHLLKMSPDEKEGFTNAAQLAGLTLSAWIRERLRLTAAQELKTAGNDVPWARTS